MIVSFKHRGLRRLYEKGDRSLIRPDMLEAIEDILVQLDDALTEKDLNLPGYRLHVLKGTRKGFLSITVRANWRIIFWLQNGNVHDVELIDYH